MMMKIINPYVKALLLFSFFIIPLGSFAYLGSDSDSSDDSSTNSQDTNQATNNTSQSNGGSGLTNEMNRKTQKGLKTFKNLLNKGQSKKSFFADQGQTPTSSELGGATFGDDEKPDQVQFHIPDSEKGRKF